MRRFQRTPVVMRVPSRRMTSPSSEAFSRRREAPQRRCHDNALSGAHVGAALHHAGTNLPRNRDEHETTKQQHVGSLGAMSKGHGVHLMVFSQFTQVVWDELDASRDTASRRAALW